MSNLVCPIRGELNSKYFATDGLTVTEEARRIDCINFLLKRGYPRSHFQCETTIVKWLGNSGSNSLRADIVVYDRPVSELDGSGKFEENEGNVLIVAEVKRHKKDKKTAVRFQLEPAMRQISKPDLYGVYWDEVNRILYVKSVKDGNISILEDSLGNIPRFGKIYKQKNLKYSDLISPEDISATLKEIANVMRSHGVNDEAIRYRETVKLLLAKYVDERESRENNVDLELQLLKPVDRNFNVRINNLYRKTGRIYSKAKSIFSAEISALKPEVLMAVVEKVQGLDLLESSNESMQQVFMTFVPAVFKKNLDQYFTPMTLIESMVEVLNPGPNDRIADPAMGTADFLTAAMQYRMSKGDVQVVSRVHGCDKDEQAYELALVNMIINKDGQTNLHCRDTIEDHDLWRGEIDVVFCNPPFGARTLETRKKVLQHYDLGHEWLRTEEGWVKTDNVAESQQLGILFIERCLKLLAEGGRIGIIVPEGYLCTSKYGYVRQWISDNLRIIGLVELPRRIFLKSDADLRSNILFGRKEAVPYNYPIHTELVRKVGYKLGKGFSVIPKRDQFNGHELRGLENEPLIDTDFERVTKNFKNFIRNMERPDFLWNGATISDVVNHPNLDMKPRRLQTGALQNLRSIENSEHVRLGDIVDVVDRLVDLASEHDASDVITLLEGQDVRAVEGLVVPRNTERCWQVIDRKTSKAIRVFPDDVIIGLVRPERRNVGFFIDDIDSVYGSPDGIAVLRQLEGAEKNYPIEWVFYAMRTEEVRIQLWTESGGTSYGKLNLDQIRNVLVPYPGINAVNRIAEEVRSWAEYTAGARQKFFSVWKDEDRFAILNSPVVGLDGGAMSLDEEEME